MRKLHRRIIGITAAVAILAQVHAGAADGQGEGTRYRLAVSGPRGVVASMSDVASAVGIDVLKRGGNAVDAAIAMVFAIGVARPDMGGLGGSGFLLYRGADGQAAALDFRETSPALDGAQPWGEQTLSVGGMHHHADASGFEYPSGHRLAGVPSVVAGMAEAHRKLGSGAFGFGDLITNNGDASRPAYAHELARDGVPVDFGLAGSLFDQTQSERMNFFKSFEQVYAAGLYGQELVQTDYADSLLLVARHGPSAFYDYDATFPDNITGLPRSSIAKRIVDDMANAETDSGGNMNLKTRAPRTGWAGEDGQPSGPNDKGFLTKDDLESYRPVWRTPLTTTYRGRQVVTMPAPSSGGVAAVEILNLLEGFPMNSGPQDTSLAENTKTSWRRSSANALHVMAESQKIAWADRARYLADPDYRYDFDGDGRTETVPQKLLTSKQYADARRGEIAVCTKPGDTCDARFEYAPATLEGRNTNHLSVIDRHGNAVAVTTSLNSWFGAAVVVPHTGIVLSNQLFDFDLGAPERANAPGPRKRPRSSQTPLIVVEDGKPVLVAGGSGGSMIPMGVLQQVVNVVDFGLDIAQAIDASRIEAGDGTLIVEAAETTEQQRVPDAVLDELRSRKHPILDSGEYFFLPLLEVVGYNASKGWNEAISDPRSGYDLFDPSGKTFGPGAAAE